MPNQHDILTNHLDLNADRPGVGLYLHVPYCNAICHYCDFAKTANFDASKQRRFITSLSSQLKAWLDPDIWPERKPPQLTSVFFGGGTPSLYTSEYEEVFAQFLSNCAPECEISLEANPDDISMEALTIWRQLGFNRLSIGVQTFAGDGLRFLKRTHSATVAMAAIESALGVFSNLNVDLIYGWAGETAKIWEADLKTSINFQIPHLSLYNLSYEARTPIGRAAQRGKLQPTAEEQLAIYYERARELLATNGYQHEEVANWSKPGFSCRHNWLYWQDRPYLAVGPGAHGYLPLPGEAIGWRYSYPRQEQLFLRTASPASFIGADLRDLATSLGASIETDRTPATWLLDYVGSGLRTCRGINLTRAAQLTGCRFQPNPTIQTGLEQNLLTITSDQDLRLTPSEWFRETAWCLAVIMSFKN